MFQLDEEYLKNRAVIKVVGVGGGGCNAVKTMHQEGLAGVEFIAANTDVQALEEHEDLDNTIQLGKQLTKGLGAGANPETGRQAAIESCEDIAKKLAGADMVFITAGMGGGTGTGAGGVIARIAKEQGSLVVGVVTRPFFFEGGRRARHAETGISFLKENVDTLIVIPNQKLLQTSTEDTSLLNAFKAVDNVLLNAVRGITDLINKKGLINLDFADVKTIMSEKGLALIGTGSAEGKDRAILAGKKAVLSPLLEENSFKGASGLIINITGGPSLSLQEVNRAAEFITSQAHPDAEIIFGALVDKQGKDSVLTVNVIATGFLAEKNKKKAMAVEATSPPEQKLSSPAEVDLAPPVVEEPVLAKSPLKPPSDQRLPRDVLLEKAKAYEQEQNAKQNKKPFSQTEQMSMDIIEKPKTNRKNNLPFKANPADSESKNTKNPFTGFFKKADKDFMG